MTVGIISIVLSLFNSSTVLMIQSNMVGVLGSMLAMTIIIGFTWKRSNAQGGMAGMLAGVAAVIFDVVINMAWPILKKKRLLPIAVMLAAFVATRFFSVNIILIILVCGVIGALDTLYLQKKEAEE